MQNFRDVKVWQKAHALTLRVYKHTKAFPVEERYGLTSQIRRAATSIGANIAEGCKRSGDAEFARFLQIALASASELDYLLMLARDLEFLSLRIHDELSSDLVEVKRMLTAFIQKLKADR
jgi:four helix bundle protein